MTNLMFIIILDLYVFNLICKVGIKLILICYCSPKNIAIFLRDAITNKSGHSELCTLHVLVWWTHPLWLHIGGPSLGPCCFACLLNLLYFAGIMYWPRRTMRILAIRDHSMLCKPNWGWLYTLIIHGIPPETMNHMMHHPPYSNMDPEPWGLPTW
jgi:hypothetical protein